MIILVYVYKELIYKLLVIGYIFHHYCAVATGTSYICNQPVYGLYSKVRLNIFAYL